MCKSYIGAGALDAQPSGRQPSLTLPPQFVIGAVQRVRQTGANGFLNAQSIAVDRTFQSCGRVPSEEPRRRKWSALTLGASAADRHAPFNAHTLRRPLEALVRAPEKPGQTSAHEPIPRVCNPVHRSRCARCLKWPAGDPCSPAAAQPVIGTVQTLRHAGESHRQIPQ